jgi:hypothetical protein
MLVRGLRRRADRFIITEGDVGSVRETPWFVPGAGSRGLARSNPSIRMKRLKRIDRRAHRSRIVRGAAMESRAAK